MNRSARRRLGIQAATGAVFLAAAGAAVIPLTAQAAVACSGTALVTAIKGANASGGGNVVLTPGCTYILTASSATGKQGADGLPIITTVVTLTGDANVIERSSSAPDFRIAEVSSTGNLTLKSVTLEGGLATGDGGGVLNYGAVTFTGSALSDNTALLGTGGGLANEGVAAPGTGTAATFTSSKILGNVATGDGGAVYNGLRGTLTVTSSTVSGNRSSAKGGGIAASNSTATTVTTTPVSANSAIAGAGGIYRLDGTMTITASPITGNTPNNCVGSSPTVPSCSH
jgi:hypothetical protein